MNPWAMGIMIYNYLWEEGNVMDKENLEKLKKIATDLEKLCGDIIDLSETSKIPDEMKKFLENEVLAPLDDILFEVNEKIDTKGRSE